MKVVYIKRITLLIIGILMASEAHAICIAPTITPRECDFKNEDTHLWGNQPGLYFAKEDRVDELIEQGESFIENYHSSVKTTGDAAIRYMIAPTAAAMTVVEVQQAILTAQMLANDPWSLKRIYTDFVCEVYWEAVGLVYGVDRDCPTTSELLTELQKLQRLDELRQEITDIIVNPNLILGEQWNNSIDEVNAIRARLQSLETFGRNIPTPDMAAFFDERYPSLAALLAAPDESMIQFRERVGRLNTSRQNTIHEHLMATHQNHLNLRDIDQPELERLSDMSVRAVGRMQATEIDNMIGMQDVQNYQAIIEEVINVTTLYMQDMADTNGDGTRRRAYAIKMGEPIPMHEAVDGNGRRFMQ